MKKTLEWELRNELIILRDRCWGPKGTIKFDKVREYEEQVKHYKNLGYSVSVHELVLENLYRKADE